MTLPTRILHLISEQVPAGTAETIEPATDLHTLGDHLKFYEIVMAVEDSFDVEISDDQAESLKTAQDLIDLVSAKVGELT